ncbi:MAG TPA: branched-chain amino acid ABC transporter permease, partial [Polyangiaceae bacterium]|nr:branched-chain amino acid ABC transporter permease [Polyangiaceae bacterium]
GWPWVLGALGVSVAAGLSGGVAEVTLYRPLYKKGELAQMLLTFGLVFVVTGVLTLAFGVEFKRIPLPEVLAGEVSLGFRTYPVYRLFVIGVGACLGLGLWLGIDRTLYGARLRAAVDNPGMARAVGMNVDRLFTGTFVLGCGLAGLGGVIGSELLLVEPSYALKYLVTFLVVVVVGGHASFKGSFAAALLLGSVETLGKFYLPSLAAYLSFVLVLLLLLWRPHGVLPAKSLA